MCLLCKLRHGGTASRWRYVFKPLQVPVVTGCRAASPRCYVLQSLLKLEFLAL